MKRSPLSAFFALLLLSVSAFAAPELTIRYGAQTLVFDREELETFPQTTIVTATPYFDGTREFTGPTLRRVLEAFGLAGQRGLTFRALNDYQVTATLDELMGLGAIVATRMDGNLMSVRNRGPFWIMLPLSDRPALNNETFHRYMVWQLSAIELD